MRVLEGVSIHLTCALHDADRMRAERVARFRERQRHVLTVIAFAALTPAIRLFYRWDDHSFDFKG